MIKEKLILTILLAGAGFISCGIDEYYYLPQVPEGGVTVNLNTEAILNLPDISNNNEYYYASSYTIFYRIYASDFLTSSSTDIARISPSLASDYNYFSSYTNPANTTSITSSSTFKSRNYFELEFDGTKDIDILPKSGGTFRIRFPVIPWSVPAASLNGGQEFFLFRSSEMISPQPRNDLFFRNTPELRSYENANANINADVAGRSGEMQYAYVSMYIVATGVNPGNFTPIYSKPAHISIFRLPDTN